MNKVFDSIEIKKLDLLKKKLNFDTITCNIGE